MKVQPRFFGHVVVQPVMDMLKTESQQCDLISSEFPKAAWIESGMYGAEMKASPVLVSWIVNLAAEVCPKRCWRGPKSQEVGGGRRLYT